MNRLYYYSHRKCDDVVNLLVYRPETAILTPRRVKESSCLEVEHSTNSTPYVASNSTPRATPRGTTNGTPRICNRIDILKPRVLNSPVTAGKRKLSSPRCALDTPTLVCRASRIAGVAAKHPRFDDSSLILLNELDESREDNVSEQYSTKRNVSKC